MSVHAQTNRGVLAWLLIICTMGATTSFARPPIESAMREYQAKYEFLANRYGWETKTLTWPRCEFGCGGQAPAPPYPKEGFYDAMTDTKAQVMFDVGLVRRLVYMYRFTNGISGRFEKPVVDPNNGFETVEPPDYLPYETGITVDNYIAVVSNLRRHLLSAAP